MENINQKIEKPLSPTEEYYPDWDYNPSELMVLAVWHKKGLPEDAINKINSAIDNILGINQKLPGQWILDKKEFSRLVEGYSQCHTIPKQLEDRIIEVIKYWKKQNEKK